MIETLRRPRLFRLVCGPFYPFQRPAIYALEPAFVPISVQTLLEFRQDFVLPSESLKTFWRLKGC